MPIKRKKEPRIRVEAIVSVPRAGEFMVAVTLDEWEADRVWRGTDTIDTVIEDHVREKLRVKVINKRAVATQVKALEKHHAANGKWK